MTRQLAVIALVGGFLLMWRAETHQDVAVAQGRKPIVATRIYTGPDGQSHAEEIEMQLTASGAAGTSEMIKATSVQFRRTPAGTFSEARRSRRHADHAQRPRKLPVVKIPLEPGRIELIEDTTGGHTTRSGTEDRVSITIPSQIDWSLECSSSNDLQPSFDRVGKRQPIRSQSSRICTSMPASRDTTVMPLVEENRCDRQRVIRLPKVRALTKRLTRPSDPSRGRWSCVMPVNASQSR
jgi:hypothetical protein